MKENEFFHTGPLYLQIRQSILDALKEGHYSADEALPSEQRLAKTFKVSQGTVRKAIDDLVFQNILYRHQGKGTFVRRHDELASLFRFFNFVRPNGKRPIPESKNISARIVTGRKAQCELFGEPSGTKLIELKRVRLIEGIPAIFETITLSQPMFRGLDKRELPNTLYQLYSSAYGIHITRAQEHVTAVSIDADQAKQLEITPATPGLRVERRAFGLNDQPVEHRVSICRSDLLTYSARSN